MRDWEQTIYNSVNDHDHDHDSGTHPASHPAPPTAALICWRAPIKEGADILKRVAKVPPDRASRYRRHVVVSTSE